MRKFESGAILFSVQDLFGYLRAHATMSGIQRVQAGIGLYGITHQSEISGFILNDLTDRHTDGEFLLIDNEALRDIILYASGDKVDHHQLRRMLDACEAAAERVRPSAGTTIILLGAFWGHGNTIDRYVTARRAGVRIGAYRLGATPSDGSRLGGAFLKRRSRTWPPRYLSTRNGRNIISVSRFSTPLARLPIFSR